MALGAGAYSGRHFPPDDARLLQGACCSSARARSSSRCITSRTCGRWAGCANTCRSHTSTVLIGALARMRLSAVAGFFSKDSIIEAVHVSYIAGSCAIAYIAALAGCSSAASIRSVSCSCVPRQGALPRSASRTSIRTTPMRHDAHDTHEPDTHHDHAWAGEPHESPWVVTLPLILLAIPSVVAGWLTSTPCCTAAISAKRSSWPPNHEGLRKWPKNFTARAKMVLHSVTTLPFWLALAGALTAWYFYIMRARIAWQIRAEVRLCPYHPRRTNTASTVSTTGSSPAAPASWAACCGSFGDVTIIDGIMVNGTAKLIGWFSGVLRNVQSGYIYTMLSR